MICSSLRFILDLAWKGGFHSVQDCIFECHSTLCKYNMLIAESGHHDKMTKYENQTGFILTNVIAKQHSSKGSHESSHDKIQPRHLWTTRTTKWESIVKFCKQARNVVILSGLCATTQVANNVSIILLCYTIIFPVSPRGMRDLLLLKLRLHKLHFFNFMIANMIRIFSFQETSWNEIINHIPFILQWGDSSDFLHQL